MTCGDENRAWRRVPPACVLPRRSPRPARRHAPLHTWDPVVGCGPHLPVSDRSFINSLSRTLTHNSPETLHRHGCGSPTVALKRPHKFKATNALRYNDRHFLLAACDGSVNLLWEKAKTRQQQKWVGWNPAYGISGVPGTLGGPRLQPRVTPAQFLIELAWINWLFIFRSSSLVRFSDTVRIAPFIPVMKVENAVAAVITAPQPEQCVPSQACERH